MKVWIYERCNKVSTNYHTAGGLVVIAKDEEERDRLLANVTDGWSVEPIEIDLRWGKDPPNPTVLELSGEYESRVIVFPDAGCC